MLLWLLFRLSFFSEFWKRFIRQIPSHIETSPSIIFRYALESQALIDVFEIWQRFDNFDDSSPTFLMCLGYISRIPQAWLGHILGIYWAYLEHTLGIARAYLRHIWEISYFGDIFGISWEYLWHTFDISWTYLGYILDISCAYLRQILGICCAFLWHSLSYFGISSPFFRMDLSTSFAYLDCSYYIT